MTKKSDARLARDKAKKQEAEFFRENKVFDELNDIHQKIVEQIQTFGVISSLAVQQDLCDQLENKDVINNKINLLAIDLKKVIQDLNDTFKTHQEKTGGSQDPDEHMNALMIFQNYLQITAVVDGVIFPTASVILEEFSKAEIKLKKLAGEIPESEPKESTEVTAEEHTEQTSH